MKILFDGFDHQPFYFKSICVESFALKTDSFTKNKQLYNQHKPMGNKQKNKIKNKKKQKNKKNKIKKIKGYNEFLVTLMKEKQSEMKKK